MYRANYHCFVDGQQEKLYFNRLEKLLKKGREKVVTFSTTVNNYNYLPTVYSSYDVACVFDNDLDKVRFENIARLCSKYNKKAQGLRKNDRHRVFHAYSNICFDLWLLLHKENYTKPESSTEAYVSRIRKNYGLPVDANIKEKKNIEKIVSQIDLDDVKTAISRAKKIRTHKLDSDKIRIDKTNYFYYNNPDFSIDIFLEQVIKDFESH